MIYLLLLALARFDPKPPKAIEILRLPRILLAGNDLPFQIRLHPINQDRRVFAMLCRYGDRCSTLPLEHERWSGLSIEGEAASPLWAPAPWRQLGEGKYLFVTGIGPDDGIRASASLIVLVRGFGY